MVSAEQKPVSGGRWRGIAASGEMWRERRLTLRIASVGRQLFGAPEPLAKAAAFPPSAFSHYCGEKSKVSKSNIVDLSEFVYLIARYAPQNQQTNRQSEWSTETCLSATFLLKGKEVLVTGLSDRSVPATEETVQK